MIRDVNLLNSGKANRLVPKSEVLSAEATFSSFISLASTFFLSATLLNLDASFL